MNRLLVLLGIALAASPQSTMAFTDSIPPGGLPSASQYGAMLLPKVDGTLSWETLAEVEPLFVKGHMVPKFSQAIEKLDNKPVLIYGFIIPLNFGKDQRHFLICPVPPHCPFCIPAGPEATIEVLAAKRVPYQFEPVLVTGTFVLVKDDPNGLLYRMTGATQLPDPTLKH